MILSDGANDEAFSYLPPNMSVYALPRNLQEMIQKDEQGEYMAVMEVYVIANQELDHPMAGGRKRRFVQEASIAAIGRVLRLGGELRFATDIADYAAWTLRHMLRSPDFEWTAERADDWRGPWQGFPGTRYEAKARREGRAPCYLIFRRKNG